MDKITMYGEGNTARLVEDIVKSTTQVSDGLSEGIGLDLKSLLAGFLGGKMAGNTVVSAPPQQDKQE